MHAPRAPVNLCASGACAPARARALSVRGPGAIIKQNPIRIAAALVLSVSLGLNSLVALFPRPSLQANAQRRRRTL
eukprot:904514-Pleurochrysis_carterae.AAC.1